MGALFLLKQGITVDDFDNMEKMQSLNWPQSAIELARGEMGMPHRGFPEQMQKAILKDKLKPMVGRPGDTLAPEDFAKVKADMEAEFGTTVTEEDVQAFLMYPAFFHGLEVGEKIQFEIPGAGVAEA